MDLTATCVSLGYSFRSYCTVLPGGNTVFPVCNHFFLTKEATVFNTEGAWGTEVLECEDCFLYCKEGSSTRLWIRLEALEQSYRALLLCCSVVLYESMTKLDKGLVQNTQDNVWVKLSRIKQFIKHIIIYRLSFRYSMFLIIGKALRNISLKYKICLTLIQFINYLILFI